ncbi:MAG: hypothetical protein WC521_00505 [Bdellovibrionales bacterium]
MKLISTLIAALFMTLLAVPASAALYTFDDIATNTTPDPDGYSYLAAIPNGYAGLNWTNFLVEDITVKTVGGLANGAESYNNVALNAYGTSAQSVTATTPFTLTSGYFMAAWNEGLELNIIGMLGGVEKYNATLILSTVDSYNFILNMANIDTLLFSSSGGNPVFQLTVGKGTQFGFDNLVISAVPLPAALPLFAGAMMVLGGVKARKRKA